VKPDRAYDVVIVGGGPAGLSAALVLGRSCRKVLVCDAGDPRNSASDAVHGFLTREGMAPCDLLALAREQLQPYDVDFCEGTVMSVQRENGDFAITLLDGSVTRGRKVLLATGVVDKLPSIPCIEGYYGKSIHHCPYCDGWEHRNERIAVYGPGRGAAALAIKLKVWSQDVILCTEGPAKLRSREFETLARHDIRVYQKKIRRLEGVPPRLSQIVFEDGSSVERTCIFFSTGNTQRSELLQQLGVELSQKGAVKVTRKQRTNVPGVFVCGDAAEDSQYVIIAAAHGARAAMAINNDLTEEDLG
jgi:thioredoxin reductase